MSSTPARIATMPTTMRTTWSVEALCFARPPIVKHTVPPTSRTTESNAERCSRAGRGGRPDKAATVGIRDTARPGHQAAAEAVSIASTAG